MSDRISMEKLNEAFEWDERALDLRKLKASIRKRGSITLDTGPHSKETIDLNEAPGLLEALDRYFDGIIVDLDRDIRALGIEPTPFTAATGDAR